MFFSCRDFISGQMEPKPNIIANGGFNPRTMFPAPGLYPTQPVYPTPGIVPPNSNGLLPYNGPLDQHTESLFK